MGNESGTARRKMTSSRFGTPLGFSNGWAEFAPKTPPPFWANILIDSQEATGPIGMLWDAPSNDPVVRRPFKVCGTPWELRRIATTTDTGKRIVRTTLVRSA